MRYSVLQFLNEVHHQGLNVTVRRGNKWFLRNQGVAVVLLNGGNEATAVWFRAVKYVPFIELTDADLVRQHDPACRNKVGLLEAMQRAYEDFDVTEPVTVVEYTMPAFDDVPVLATA